MALIRGIKWKKELDILKIMNIVADKIPGVKLLAVGREKAFTELPRKLRENGLETARRHTWDAVTDRVEAALLKEIAASAR